jgi:hypothetical protein
MKVLYILKQDPDSTLSAIMEEHKKTSEVTVVDLRAEKDYGRLIDLISDSEKVISW